MQALNIPNRNPSHPVLFELQDHPQVAPPHGRIIMMSHCTDAKTMANILDASLSTPLPANKAESDGIGEYLPTEHTYIPDTHINRNVALATKQQ
jgi:hypothetical protein